MCLSGGSLNTALNPVMYLTSSIEPQYSDVLNLTLNFIKVLSLKSDLNLRLTLENADQVNH